MGLNRMQQTKLINATLNAEGRGQCLYFNRKTKRPECVIAHLAASEGVSEERLGAWRGSISQLHDGRQSLAVPELGVYPVALLEKLQSVWDDGAEFIVGSGAAMMEEDEARMYMLFLIEADSE